MTEEEWFIIRASNTTPKIKIVAEAKTAGRVDQLLKVAIDELEEAKGSG